MLSSYVEDIISGSIMLMLENKQIDRKEICIEVDTLHQAIQIITSIIGIFENDVNVYDANEFCRMENDKSGLFSFKVKDTFVGISYGNEIDEYMYEVVSDTLFINLQGLNLDV